MGMTGARTAKNAHVAGQSERMPTTGVVTARNVFDAGQSARMLTSGRAVNVPHVTRRETKGMTGVRIARNAPAAGRSERMPTSGMVANARRAERRVMRSMIGVMTVACALCAERLGPMAREMTVPVLSVRIIETNYYVKLPLKVMRKKSLYLSSKAPILIKVRKRFAVLVPVDTSQLLSISLLMGLT
jgi:hypothetical protein